MKKSLNIPFIFRNKHFREIVFSDTKNFLLIFLFSFISIAVVVSFPLITQLYIRHLYVQNSLNLLFSITGIFLVLFILKLIIDIFVEKQNTLYFLNLERRIKKLIIKKYGKKLHKLISGKTDLFSKHIYLYKLLVKNIYRNILDLITIFLVIVLIFFFDKGLFVYFLFSLPFFILFYLIGKRIDLNYGENLETSRAESDFSTLAHRALRRKMSEKQVLDFFDKNIENDFRKKIKNQTKHLSLNMSMNSFVGFYRLFYLAYFGYYIIVFDIQISGLIVGLLFITILIRPFVSLLKSIPFYSICARSFFKINGLLKE